MKPEDMYHSISVICEFIEEASHAPVHVHVHVHVTSSPPCSYGRDVLPNRQQSDVCVCS